MVLFILIGLGGLMAPLITGVREDSADRTTKATLVAIRDAMLRQRVDTKYVALTGSPDTVAEESERFQIRWLFESPVSGVATSDFDPDSRVGWNGPYLASFTGRYQINALTNFTATYGANDDPALLDSFNGSPIVVQVVGTTAPFDLRVVSAGPDGVLDIAPTDATTDLVPEGGSQSVGDDVYVSFVLR